MLLKRVRILKNGNQIDFFDCAVCDLTHQLLNFHGVVNKDTGKCDHDKTYNYIGNSYIEIDRLKRECIVIPEVPEIQFLITW